MLGFPGRLEKFGSASDSKTVPIPPNRLIAFFYVVPLSQTCHRRNEPRAQVPLSVRRLPFGSDRGQFLWYGARTGKLVLKQNPRIGPLIVSQALVEVHNEVFNSEYSGYTDVLVDTNNNLKNLDFKWRRLIPERPNSAQPVAEKFGPQDEFEANLLAEFQAAQPPKEGETDREDYRERYIEENNFYQYYQPIWATASCLTSCHVPPETGDSLVSNPTLSSAFGSSSANAEGELMAVIVVTIPNKKIQTTMNKNRAILISIAIITVFLAMVAAYVIVRYVIAKPLKHLRDVSEAVSHGNTAIRAEIHTGDEFESLAIAFNQMLQHMVSAHEELRHVNADLDGKVDELAQANMQLYETNRIKSDFLATMSHELRTPLNSILGFSDVLVSIDSLDEKQKRYVSNIQKSGRMLLEMINSILDLAKIESGRAEVKLSEFSIDQIIGRSAIWRVR